MSYLNHNVFEDLHVTNHQGGLSHDTIVAPHFVPFELVVGFVK